MNEVLAESKARFTGMAIVVFVLGLIVGVLVNGFYIGASFYAVGLVSGICFVLVFVLIYGGNRIVVTKESITGVTIFRKKVSIPTDSVSAVASAAFHSVAITSASGAIKFPFMEKRDEVYEVINSLLSERQNNKKDAGPTTIVTQEMPKSEAEELKKFKELLDNGIITQEEFDAKKKQLLGL